MSINPNERVIIEGTLERKTDKAILLMVRTEEVWLPKSQITYDDNSEVGQMIEVDLPYWLAKKNEVL